MKTLILVRGCSGAGKSTFAKLLGGVVLETDKISLTWSQGELTIDSFASEHIVGEFFNRNDLFSPYNPYIRTPASFH